VSTRLRIAATGRVEPSPLLLLLLRTVRVEELAQVLPEILPDKVYKEGVVLSCLNYS
jgi:hypothetical protein